jgi:putative transport protein
VDGEIIEFAREFGLILFVFTIGLQVGPSFFASLRKQGLKLNLLAAAVVFLGVATAIAVHFLGGVPIAVVVGLLSGAVTNTPGLGAAQQALKEALPHVADAGELSGMAYAVAYPFGIIGIILTMIASRWIFHINTAKEAAELEQAQSPAGQAPQNFNIRVTNPRLNGQEIRSVASLVQAEFVVSRLLRGDDVMLPKGDTRLELGDILHVVCTAENADKLAIVVGDISQLDVRTIPSDLTATNVLITRKDAVGKTIRELDLLRRYGATITRLHRAGIELVARSGMRISFGDRVTVVGEEASLKKVASELGNSMKQLNHPNLLPIFIGIILGVVIGSMPFTVPGVPAPVKLGIAGGPLLVAILLSRIGRIGPVVWYLPQSANLIVREIGITLFLASVGLKSGGRFVATLLSGDGLLWMGLGALITLLPLALVAVAARAMFKLNYVSLCGLLAGSMTDPPALSFAHQTTGSDGPAVTYASVYALVMFLRILTAQALVLILS